MTTPLGGRLFGAELAPGALRGLLCPSCGAAVALRAAGWTQTVACAHCAAVLDASDPNLRLVQEGSRRAGPEPAIPLGTRGRWRGADYEAIGYQEQAITVDGSTYAWREYVLFNPYHGFRYLTEYDGHWNDVVPVRALPAHATEGGRRAVRLDGTVYRHFQTATARTRRVLGEFPWEARTGDEVEARDYVAPPFVLSAEDTPHETTWSRGEYVDGHLVWQAFGLPGAPPAARGVYANQPSPHAGGRSLTTLFAVFAALLVLAAVVRYAAAGNAVAFSGQYTFTPGVDGDAAAVTGFAPAAPGAAPGASQAFVTPAFTLAPGRLGRPASVVLETATDLDNQWMAVEYTLIDEATGRAYETARELGYFTGYDADGRWTEGSRRDRVRFGSVPSGRYFLRVEPVGGDAAGARPVAWSLTVRRDVPRVGFFLLALVALAVPPAVAALRASSFEYRRWQESDYPSTTAADVRDALSSEEEE